MKVIKILGTGCPKCQQLAAVAEAAAQDLGIDYEVEKVQDLNAIMAYGVMVTPAMVVDGEVKVSGKVPSAEDMKGLLG